MSTGTRMNCYGLGRGTHVSLHIFYALSVFSSLFYDTALPPEVGVLNVAIAMGAGYIVARVLKTYHSEQQSFGSVPGIGFAHVLLDSPNTGRRESDALSEGTASVVPHLQRSSSVGHSSYASAANDLQSTPNHFYNSIPASEAQSTGSAFKRFEKKEPHQCIKIVEAFNLCFFMLSLTAAKIALPMLVVGVAPGFVIALPGVLVSLMSNYLNAYQQYRCMQAENQQWKAYRFHAPRWMLTCLRFFDPKINGLKYFILCSSVAWVFYVKLAQAINFPSQRVNAGTSILMCVLFVSLLLMACCAATLMYFSRRAYDVGVRLSRVSCLAEDPGSIWRRLEWDSQVSQYTDSRGMKNVLFSFFLMTHAAISAYGMYRFSVDCLSRRYGTHFFKSPISGGLFAAIGAILAVSFHWQATDKRVKAVVMLRNTGSLLQSIA